jgi:hypothetical protein
VAKDLHFCCGGRFMMLIKPLTLLLLVGLFLLLLHFLRDGEARADLFSASMVGDTRMWTAIIWLPLEFAVHLSRLFSQEIKEQTLSSLCLIPYRSESIVAAKLLAALLALIPVLVILSIGIVLSPADFLKAFKSSIGETGFWMTVSCITLFLNLTAFFTLLMRRGALVVALGSVLGGLFIFMMVGSLVFNAREGGIMTFLIFIMFLSSIVVFVNIPRRFAKCASQ